MVELHDVTILLKDPSVGKVRAVLQNLRNMGVAFPTQLSSQSIHGLATPEVVDQLKQARDVLVLSRRLEIVEGTITRSIDAATALREMEEKEAAREAAEKIEQEEAAKKKKPKKKKKAAPKKKAPKKKKRKAAKKKKATPKKKKPKKH